MQEERGTPQRPALPQAVDGPSLETTGDPGQRELFKESLGVRSDDGQPVPVNSPEERHSLSTTYRSVASGMCCERSSANFLERTGHASLRSHRGRRRSKTTMFVLLIRAALPDEGALDPPCLEVIDTPEPHSVTTRADRPKPARAPSGKVFVGQASRSRNRSVGVAEPSLIVIMRESVRWSPLIHERYGPPNRRRRWRYGVAGRRLQAEADVWLITYNHRRRNHGEYIARTYPR